MKKNTVIERTAATAGRHELPPPYPENLIVQSLRIEDPRQFGPDKACTGEDSLADLVWATAQLEDEWAAGALNIQIRDLIGRGDETALSTALAACPDSRSYRLLYGLAAYEACSWTSSRPSGRTGRTGRSGCYSLFGIPFTLHTRDEEQTPDWTPEGWGPENNGADLDVLRDILRGSRATDGMQDFVILPRLVDPAELARLRMCDAPALAKTLFHALTENKALFETNAEHSRMFEHRPWRALNDSAQCRMLVLASRSKGQPYGLDRHHDACADELNSWAARVFGIPSGLLMMSSSPERLLSLLSGKALTMSNCANLLHLLGREDTPGDVSSLFVSTKAASTTACHGELTFHKGDASCVWRLHGRTDWNDVVGLLRRFMTTPWTRFVRAQLGMEASA